MSDWQAQNEEVWAQVMFALADRTQPTIAWITCDSFQHLRALVAEFKQRFPDNRHFEHRIEKFEENSFPPYFRNHLPSEAFDDSKQHAFVHLFGLELHVGVGNSQPASRLFEALNFEREVVFLDLPFTTVIWSDTYSQIKAQTLAPDFWDWLTKKFHFEAPEAVVEREVAFANESKSLVAPEKRAALYHQISQHIRLLDRTDRPADRMSLLEVIADNYQALQDYDKAVAYRKQLLALGDLLSPAARARHLNLQGLALLRLGDYDYAMHCFEDALVICQEIGDRNGEGRTLNNISQIYHARGNYASALRYLEQSLKIRQEIGDNVGEGTSLNNIGQIYCAKGDNDKASYYLEQSLKIWQEIGDLGGEGTTLNNISQIYSTQGDYTSALSYLEQSLKIRRQIGDRVGEGASLNNIGQIYSARGDNDTALGYLEQSLKICQEIGNGVGVGTILNNIGHINNAQGEVDSALRYFELSLKIQQEIGDYEGQAASLHNIGATYVDLEQFEKAVVYLFRASAIYKKLNSPDLEFTQTYLEQIQNELGSARYQELVSQVEVDDI